MKALPGQFRIHGRKPRKGESAPQLDVLVGEGVSEEAARFLRRQFLEPGFTVQHVYERELPPDPAFCAELGNRGYDLATFRLSVFAKGYVQRVPRPILMQMRPAVLHARWSWEEHDHSPDIVCCWSKPGCFRTDSNLFLSLMSMPLLESRAQPSSRSLLSSASKEFQRLELDIRTFRFEVRHKDGAPGAAPFDPERRR